MYVTLNACRIFECQTLWYVKKPLDFKRLKVSRVYTASGWPVRYVMFRQRAGRQAGRPPAHSKSLARHQRLISYYEANSRLNEITDGISIFFSRNESCLLRGTPNPCPGTWHHTNIDASKTPQKRDIHSTNKTHVLHNLTSGGGAKYPIFHFHGNPFPPVCISKSQSPIRHLTAPSPSMPPSF